jgi:hypothetical protein
MRYYLEYNLGWYGPGGCAAIKGTIVHKVLEIFAIIKKAQQEGKKDIYDAEFLKNIKIKDIPDDMTLTEQVFEFYTKNNEHINWTKKDLTDCKSWVNKTLEMNGGIFDPRDREIVQPEQEFDIEIPYDWANYSYDVNGQKVEGKLHIKGTIDLLVKVDEGFYEIIDWKTGKKFNWGKGVAKTDNDLKSDPQLMLYHYAATLLYPEIEDILVTINFINDGGPTSVAFTKKDIKRTEEMLKTKFELIKQTRIPRLNRGWKCSKFCHQGKTTFEGTGIDPQIEDRENQVTPMGELRTKCEQTKYMLANKGMDWVNEHYTKKGFSVASYKAPGSVT